MERAKKVHGVRRRPITKIISFLLALAMMMTMPQGMSQLGMTVTAKAAAGTMNITVHLKADDWEQPAFYYWGIDGAQVAPVFEGDSGKASFWTDGQENPKFTKNEDGFWTLTIKSGEGLGGLFVDLDGEEPGAPPIQTEDIKIYEIFSAYTEDTPKDVYGFISDGGSDGKKKVDWYFDEKDIPAEGTVVERDVYVPGKLPSDTGKEWDEKSNKMEYLGSGLYRYTFKNVSAGEYPYKIALNGSWDENYGMDGIEDGSNYSVKVPETMDVIIWYSDISHLSQTNLNYIQGADVSLSGTGIPSGTKLTDTQLTGKYTAKVKLAAGTYDDVKITYKGKTYDLAGFVVSEEGDVTFNFNPMSEEFGCDAIEAEVKSGAEVNAVGMVTFTAGFAEMQTSAELTVKYADKDTVKTKGEEAMETAVLKATSKLNKAFKSDALWLGDAACELVYYFEVDGAREIADGVDTTEINGESYMVFQKPEFEGRKVFVPGTFPGPSWDAASNPMTYAGNGLYTYTFKDVPAANYEYKISIDGSWDENYGLNGGAAGANIAVAVTEQQDVTVYYSDFSHNSRTSINYVYGASVELKGTGIPSGTKLTDDRLTGIYSATVAMSEGTYTDTVIVYNDTEYPVGKYTVSAAKDVHFYFDPETGLSYNDASAAKVDTAKLYYDSRDLNYKKPYGAIATGEAAVFTIQTGEEATAVELYVKGKETKKVTLEKSGDAANGLQKWSGTLTLDTIGEYDYYFAVHREGALQIYADDDGNYGTGKACDLLDMTPYDLIVYQSGYKTPDWMKNGVIYQIFPERFYNGDVTNDTATSDARGTVQYEYMPDWYIWPENPEQESDDRIATYPAQAYQGDKEWSNEIYGGDLKGITERIDYLKALGVTVIYLNPVFESISSHRYDTSDYKNIDPILGTLGDFEELVNTAEENGMYVVLDGVFNHVSDDSVYFDRYYEYLEEGTDTIGAYPYWAYVYDYMKEKGVDQQAAEAAAKEYFAKEYGITNFDYAEWFDVFQDKTLKNDAGEAVCDSVGLRAGKPVYGYDGWWGYDSMPIIKSTNGSEYQSGTWAAEVIGKNETSTTADNSVAQYWLSKGMDGWRLDVANEVSDETWQHFRKSVKALNSDNVIIGEIWTDAVQYLMGDMYDSVMNYVFRGAAMTFAKAESEDAADEAIATLERIRERYPQEAFYAMMNLVDSHDTTRVLSYLDGIDDDRNQKEVEKAFPTYEATSDTAKKRQYLVALMQFTYAGAPTVYYGDELGMVGSDDPDDRRPMIWGEGNKDLVEWYAKLAKIRSSYTALRTGSVEVYDVDEPSIMGYVRRDDASSLLVLMNNAGQDVTLSNVSLEKLGDVTAVTDMISGAEIAVSGQTATVTVPAYSGVILVDSAKKAEISIASESLKPGYDPAYKVTERAVKVTGVSFSENEVSVRVGDAVSLSDKLVVAPENATTKTAKWKTSDKTVATVDADGRLTAVGTGTATITATTKDGLFTATCTVKVEPAPAGVPVPSAPGASSGTQTAPETGTYKEVEKADGSKQFVDSSGKVVTNSFVTAEDGNTYYTLEDGTVAENQIVAVDDAKYFAKEDGVIAKKEFCTTPDGDMVYALEDGKLAANRVITVNGRKYFATEDSTIAKSGFFATAKGNKVYARSDGTLITGRSFSVNGKRYYTAASGAVVKSGFHKTANGKRVYAKASGALVAGGTFKVDGKRYYANKSGVIAVKKWVQVGNKKYYCSASGAITKVKTVKK